MSHPKKSAPATKGSSGISNIAIPKIIHQTYKSRTLPTDYKLWREQCMKLNPTWTFKLWTDSDNREFVANVYPELLSLYDNYNANIKRIDMVRYLYLDTIGGMYMDLDFTCLKPFDESFDSIHEFTVAPQYKASYSEFANAWMASPPNSPVVKQIIQKLPETQLLDVLSATGPVFLTTILKNENHDNWNELRFEEIYCQVWNDNNMCTSYENCRTKCPSAFTVSLWTHSWGHKKKERTWQRRKLELVHITKTGGSSLEFAASRAGINWGVCHYQRMKSLGCTSPDLDRGYQASPWHVPPKYLTSSHPRQNPYVQADLFTVIRNPYSRFVSEFHCPWMGIQSSGGQLRIAMFGNTTTTALSTVQKADYILNPDIMNVWIQWKVTQIHTAIQEVKKKGTEGYKRNASSVWL